MIGNECRRAWQTPWGYTESIAIVAGVVAIGAALQLTVGSFDFFTLAAPANFMVGAAIILLSLLFGLLTDKSHFARWISSAKLSTVEIIATLLLTIIMGLTPQVASESLSPLGFDSMTSAWSFVLLYGFTLLTLGATITRRLRRFRLTLRDISFQLSHIGLWLLLAASGLGYADMERYVMYVEEGQTEWRVYNAEKEVKELPIAITLVDFDMEVYPPKLAIIDRETGAMLPEQRPQLYQIDKDATSGTIGAGWEIELVEYIHNAVRSSDSTYREVPMPGATPATRVRLTKDGSSIEGWVCSGNQSQIYMTLPLNSEQCVVMTEAEPRKFSSVVEVFTEGGLASEATIEVNHPLRIGGWWIYQYGYDNAMGRLSSYSSFELVYDPWLTVVYIGIILMMLGAVTLICGGKNRGIEYDVE